MSYFRADRVINDVLAPLVVKGLGLPHELGVTLVFGFLRKELSLIMMLQALGVDYQNLMTVISREQIVVFTVFISFFIPCLSTFVILWKEIGKKWAFLSVGLSVGGRPGPELGRPAGPLTPPGSPERRGTVRLVL
ncbi:MAG: hypothetical protein M0C28_02795 [Candidatus Moduliflexus flocculans]|nr:hypothetical protein [Candidatus Moduliflexus flocculans]